MTAPIVGQFDTLPPHSIESEMCLLASMMLDREAIGSIVPIVRDRSMLYQADHQIIFGILVELWEKNVPIDSVVVARTA